MKIDLRAYRVQRRKETHWQTREEPNNSEGQTIAIDFVPMGCIDRVQSRSSSKASIRVRHGGDPKEYLKGNHMYGIPSSVLDWRALAFDPFNTGQLECGL
jgi:hypothetical protein